MALLTRSIGGLSKCFYQGLWLAVPSAAVIGQSIKRCGVALEFPHYGMVSSSVCAWLLYGFPYRFQRPRMVLWSIKHLLDVMQVGAWNSLQHCSHSTIQTFKVDTHFNWKSWLGILSIQVGFNWNIEIWIKVQIFSLKKMHLKMSSVKCPLFCSDLSELTHKRHPPHSTRVMVSYEVPIVSTCTFKPLIQVAPW